jgi:DNA-binding transcriptional LysR family regulator
VGVDLDAVRTFVAVAEAGRFTDAADDLSITQQAVSKRIAALEKDLAVRLFTRTARGVQLTIDGQAFLPHARHLLRADERAADSVRPGRRALCVDVINPRIAPALLMRDFHRAHPGIELDVVTHLFDADAAIAAVGSGVIDASFRAVTKTARQLPAGVEVARVLDDPLQLLTGPAHKLATARAVTPAELAGHRIWMPAASPEPNGPPSTTSSPGRSGSRSTRSDPTSAPTTSWRRSRAPLPWPPSSANRCGSSGPSTTTCGASPCTARYRSTRTH